jgi:hypothetical protein
MRRQIRQSNQLWKARKLLSMVPGSNRGAMGLFLFCLRLLQHVLGGRSKPR